MPDDGTAAIRLLEEALHLRQNGERAPGGDETWRDWERKAEECLRAEHRRRFRESLRTGRPWPYDGPEGRARLTGSLDTGSADTEGYNDG